MAIVKSVTKYVISSWNAKKNDWDFEAKEQSAASAKSWAKKQSNVYTKTFKVEKIIDLGHYKNNKEV